MNGSIHVEVLTETGSHRLQFDASPVNQSLADMLRRQGLPLNTRCGQRGVCEGCVVELLDGAIMPLDDGGTIHAHGNVIEVRACTMRLPEAGCVTLRLPPRSLLAHRPQVLTDFVINIPWAHDPLFKGSLAAAIDIGTTTVVVALIDLADGRVLTRTAAFNRQMHLGDDVLSRINLCMVDATNIHTMRHAVVAETIAPLLDQCLREAGRRIDDLAGITVAGNTTMLHLLVGADPTSMGLSPFTPSFLDHHITTAGAIGLSATPSDLPIHLLPGAAAYIGADVVAGALASGLIYDDGPNLLIDIGTNGEIILGRAGRLTACATAAGPAFEGAGLAAGTRAGDGAISHLTLHENTAKIRFDVIGDAAPIGLCGSAYIDLIGEGRRLGLIDDRGRYRFDACGGAFADHRAALDQLTGLHIATGQGKRPLIVTERDLATLMQAKAAIAAGTLTLLHNEGLTPAGVRRVYLAGGFGMHLNLTSAIRAGLLPGFSPEQITLIGNSSLAGAYLATVDQSVIAALASIAAGINTVELNLDPGFESRYIEQLLLP
jgi:uncharacterized 2Fe-2S/4Fe-4S cluster protein (DUF4445 family)